jgi:hypothetical protein
MSSPISRNAGLIGLLLLCATAAPCLAQFKRDLPYVPIPCKDVASIGVAQMSADGVITLRLRGLDPNPIAEGELTYAPDDPQYLEIKQHLGGISPGETKAVPPWCDQ